MITYTIFQMDIHIVIGQNSPKHTKFPLNSARATILFYEPSQDLWGTSVYIIRSHIPRFTWIFTLLLLKKVQYTTNFRKILPRQPYCFSDWAQILNNLKSILFDYRYHVSDEYSQCYWAKRSNTQQIFVKFGHGGHIVFRIGPKFLGNSSLYYTITHTMFHMDIHILNGGIGPIHNKFSLNSATLFFGPGPNFWETQVYII